MRPMTVLAPLGMLGYGIPARSMERGLARDPAVLALDAGSTDPGPYYLGAGVPFVNRRAAKKDLTMILDAARDRGIPVLIGSAGGGGGQPHVEWTLDLYRELCRERGYRFRTAVIEAEIDRAWLRAQVAGGRVRPLDHDRALTAADVDQATRIVAQMGVEPFLAALDAGAEVVIAGRACDAAVIAALPIRAGFDPGLALHMGKILECGGAAAYPRHGSDCLLGVIEDEAFTVEPPEPGQGLHRRLGGRPLALRARQPLRAAPAPRPHRSEGHPLRGLGRSRGAGLGHALRPRGRPRRSSSKGWRASAFARSPSRGCASPSSSPTSTRISPTCAPASPTPIPTATGCCSTSTAATGSWVRSSRCAGAGPHEIGLIIEVIADDAETSAAVLALARSVALHVTYPGRQAIAGNLAFPFSPSDLRAGEAFEFTIHHLVAVDDPGALFPVTMLES